MTDGAAGAFDGSPPQSLRIALAHPFCWPEVRRGGERYLADLAAHLGRTGARVEVLTGTSGAGRVERDADGVVVRRLAHLGPGPLGRRGLGLVETFGAVLLRHLVRHRFDVVHALTPTAALAGRLTGHRTLYTVLGQPDREHFDHHPAERRVTAAAIRHATEVAALSRSAADVEHGVFGRRPVVLSPGVRTDRFPADRSPRVGPPRVLFPADASDRRKRVDLAIAAMATVLRHHPDARLVLAGPGDHRWALEALGRDAGAVGPSIDDIGVGHLDDVPRRYRDATVTVLPSEAEAFGLGVLESLACGTPAVCLAGGGPEEILGGLPVGRVCPSPDPHALGAAVTEAIAMARDPATPGRCIDRAHHWDWETTVGPEHLAQYSRLAAGRGRPGARGGNPPTPTEPTGRARGRPD